MVSASPSSSHKRRIRIAEGQRSFLVYPPAGIAQGPLWPPQNRVNTMGNTNAPTARTNSAAQQQPRSNLTALLEDQENERLGEPAPSNVARQGAASASSVVFGPNEADSASEPRLTVHSAPEITGSTPSPPPAFLPLSSARRSSASDVSSVSGHTMASPRVSTDKSVRRCISSKELGMLAPPGGSPHTYMLHQKEVLNWTMQQRLMDLRESSTPIEGSLSSSPVANDTASEGESHGSHRERIPTANERRNRRRAEHSKAVISDLCEIVADLFVAESKLLDPSHYGVRASVQRTHVLHSIEEFVSALPPRYALGVDTPSEVLLHMRLMAAVRSDQSRAVVHIVNLEGDTSFRQRPYRFLRLVTISCCDANGILEYITKLLATGGSRVLDADVMTTTDGTGIILDRFVVEMNGRLRLDKLANCIEAFLANAKEAREKEQGDLEEESTPAPARRSSSKSQVANNSPGSEPACPIYVFPPPSHEASPQELHDELQSAVPLSEVLHLSGSFGMLAQAFPRKMASPPTLRREHSMPNPPMQPMLSSPGRTQTKRSLQVGQQQPLVPTLDKKDRITGSSGSGMASTLRQRRPLVNREATIFSDHEWEGAPVVAPQLALDIPPASVAGIEDRVIPLIPFEELKLIETLGMGRVSTIYRAAWQRNHAGVFAPPSVAMVALKVATVNPETGDASHVNELRREADIASMLQHSSVCELVGVTADEECFCLAYEFCEGGSLLSLLSDNSRYYEYLPIALDIANGMAYLHSRDVIHRDLKPSNVLLTRDHRAKIADFGMSVANTGQELTAETGTYRYMAPEVIRHESYSSNADVYSFGIVLWQLITREVPFATMTPIQAAFAVAGGRRPEIPPTTPPRLQEIITACWDQDSQKRPSFTYIAMALADYARMAFSPANVGAQTLQIANEMLANVEGNSNVNVDFSTPVQVGRSSSLADFRPPHPSWLIQSIGSYSSNVGLEI